MELTFEHLPIAVNQIYNKIELIEELLSKNKNFQSKPSDEFLTVEEAASFLRLSVPTIYGLISRNAIPSMKRSKRVYFSKTELENYLKEGKKKSSEELIKETDLFILNKKGGRNGK
jgi:excisionase family DNA binding protein